MTLKDYVLNFLTAFQHSLYQVWATLFGSRATLEKKVVYAGQYKYHTTYFILLLREIWLLKVHFRNIKI